MTATPLQAMIGELEHLRQSRVILYVGQDRGQFLHQISEKDALPLFQCLRQQERVDRLDLVLNTMGGSIPTAHWLCHLLHAYGKHFSVLVPNKARSAATLLCLGANEIVMGPFAQLGPIDPHIAQYIAQRDSSAAGNPPLISAEDIRVFKDMAKTWFGIKEEGEYNIQLLQLLCGRIFPTSLAAFFRAAQQIEATAEQHLRLHLPEASLELRQKIAEYFIHGCYSHDSIITRDDAREVGLNITSPSPQEETALWRLWEICAQGFLTPPSVLPGREEEGFPLALVASTNFLARCVARVLSVPGENDAEGIQHHVQLVEHQWEMFPIGFTTNA
jgi:Serine dehydrogenase proteinase